MSSAKAFYRLTKPGIVYGNSLSAVGGYWFAAGPDGSPVGFLLMLIGLSLIIASAGVFNNLLDIDIDRKMERTARRPLPAGLISRQQAVGFGVTLLILGSLALWAINWWALGLAWFGLFAYVVLYGIAKRATVYGTEVGSISGAVPIVIGYVAYAGGLDLAAWLLFLIMVCWQMPHFFAIAAFRRQQYAATGLPIITVKRGIESIIGPNHAYSLLFLLASVSLALFGGASGLYLATMLLLGAWWLRVSAAAWRVDDYTAWSRRVFKSSLLVLLIFSCLLVIDGWLPSIYTGA